MGSQENYFGLAGQQNDNIIQSLRADTSKNKNIDHGVKETCAIMSIQTTYEIDHISHLKDSTISSALNFCIFCILL